VGFGVVTWHSLPRSTLKGFESFLPNRETIVVVFWPVLVLRGRKPVFFSVLVGYPKIFRHVRDVPNRKPISIHDVGDGTLLAILFPSNGSHSLSSLEVSIFPTLRIAAWLPDYSEDFGYNRGGNDQLLVVKEDKFPK
jgi:hypothetical protein